MKSARLAEKEIERTQPCFDSEHATKTPIHESIKNQICEKINSTINE